MTNSARTRWIHRLAVTAFVAGLVLTASALTGALAQPGPLGGLRAPPAHGVAGWIFAKQALFYRALSGLIRAAKTDGSAYWGLMGISFIYGVFHAAGPGHGKAVISSYVFANEETWRRGIALSFASALLQAFTAIALVAIAAVLLGATAKMMGDTVRVIEVVSYALIVLLGVRLFWVKGRALLRTLHTVRSGPQLANAKADGSGLHAHAPCHAHAHRDHYHHADDAYSHDHGHHAHHHAHDHGEHGHHVPHHAHDDDEEASVLPWGHAHGPEPEDLAGPGGWHRGLSAIVAVGLRPCSGAIIVLVFALAQGLFLAGIASTFVMGIGTAVTVAAIATLAVAGKATAKRFAATRAGYGSLALRGAEVGAALVVIALGTLLLTGYLASERLGMF